MHNARTERQAARPNAACDGWRTISSRIGRAQCASCSPRACCSSPSAGAHQCARACLPILLYSIGIRPYSHRARAHPAPCQTHTHPAALSCQSPHGRASMAGCARLAHAKASRKVPCCVLRKSPCVFTRRVTTLVLLLLSMKEGRPPTGSKQPPAALTPANAHAARTAEISQCAHALDRSKARARG